MEVSITQFLSDIVQVIQKKEQVGNLPEIITDQSKKMLFELFKKIKGILTRQTREDKKTENNCEELIDVIYRDLKNGHPLLPVLWNTMMLSMEIKLAPKISKVHFNKCERFQTLLDSQYKDNYLAIVSKTLQNYRKDNYDCKSRGTKKAIYSVVYILLDYFVSDDRYREYFCNEIKRLITEEYRIDTNGHNIKYSIDFSQFGTKKDEDRESIKELIIYMWDSKVRLLKSEHTIDEPIDREDNRLEFDLTIKLVRKFDKCFPGNELYDVFRLCDAKAVLDNQKYINKLYPQFIEEDPTFLKYEYCVAWISYKYLNPDVQSNSHEYQAFLLYYLLHELPWTNYLKKSCIEFSIRFDYFDYCLHRFESTDKTFDSFAHVTDHYKDSFGSDNDFFEITKQLLDLERMIALSEMFVHHLTEQKRKKKGE